jgi:antitoxin VapB
MSEPKTSVHTRLFLSNRTQAVRLPKDVAFPPGVDQVMVIRDGPRRVITPAGTAWDDFFAAPGIDIGERDQPPSLPRDQL